MKPKSKKYLAIAIAVIAGIITLKLLNTLY